MGKIKTLKANASESGWDTAGLGGVNSVKDIVPEVHRGPLTDFAGVKKSSQVSQCSTKLKVRPQTPQTSLIRRS